MLMADAGTGPALRRMRRPRRHERCRRGGARDRAKRRAGGQPTANRSLYAARIKIYPKRAHGTFRTIKWIVMAVTLGIYYLVPWLRWDRGPYLPDQAVLLDFPSRRFYFFFIEIWPQEFYYITGLLVLAALGAVPRHLARRARVVRLYLPADGVDRPDDRGRALLPGRPQRRACVSTRRPGRSRRCGGKGPRICPGSLIAVATGGAWVFYFADAPTLARQLVTFEAPIARLHRSSASSPPPPMCWAASPASRSASICAPGRASRARCSIATRCSISYRAWRGEPRGPHKSGQSWEGRGDCIDCRQCVAVCPTGIDIRDGSQLECIQCALCIDACDEIMDKVGRPRGLIAYDTVAQSGGRGTPRPFPSACCARAWCSTPRPW